MPAKKEKSPIPAPTDMAGWWRIRRLFGSAWGQKISVGTRVKAVASPFGTPDQWHLRTASGVFIGSITADGIRRDCEPTDPQIA